VLLGSREGYLAKYLGVLRFDGRVQGAAAYG
jgi:hypothetical protein